MGWRVEFFIEGEGVTNVAYISLYLCSPYGCMHIPDIMWVHMGVDPLYSSLWELSQSDLYQIHSNLLKMTPFRSISRGVRINFHPPENMQCIIGGIMLSTPSLYTSFWDTIRTYRHFITPLHPLGHSLNGKRVCGMTFGESNGHLRATDPPFGAISILIMFLKCFSSHSYPVAIENACSSVAAYSQPWSVVTCTPT